MDQNLYLNDILHLSDSEIENSKIELNSRAGVGGESFLERWHLSTDEHRIAGTTDCS